MRTLFFGQVFRNFAEHEPATLRALDDYYLHFVEIQITAQKARLRDSLSMDGAMSTPTQ